MSDNSLILWGKTSDNITIAGNQSSISQALSYATALAVQERSKIEKALDAGLYDMASEYTWKRTIGNLKRSILKLGEEFVLEMVGKKASKYSNIDDVLTELDIINLAKELGFISTTAHLLLSQQSQLIKHFIEDDDKEDMPDFTATNCILTSIKYGLSQTLDYDVHFIDFRERLFRETLDNNDEQISIIIESQYFYIKTVTRTLINLINSKEGGELDNALNNFQLFIPKVWIKLLSDDRWLIGSLYAEMVSAGNKKIAGTLKSILSRIRGFDYVPENLRSNTFISAANEFKRIHYALNNFYNEPSAIEAIYKLGTIPSPAICDCISAALLCKLGNPYGISRAAQPIADSILVNMQGNKWEYYLDNRFPVDNDILIGLYNSTIFDRWNNTVQQYALDKLSIKNMRVRRIIEATINNKYVTVQKEVDKLREGIIE